MSRRVVWIAIAAALTSMLFASVTTSGGVQLWVAPQWETAPREPQPNVRDVSEPESLPIIVEEVDDEAPRAAPGWLGTVARVVLTVFAIVGLVALLLAGWHRRPRVRWRGRGPTVTDFDVLPDVADAVIDEADTQRAALLTGEPRNAIVQCWLQLERDVADAGLSRHPADTSAEFTERVLGQYTVDPEAIRELAALYREARFSRHTIDEPTRSAALDALDRLHAALRTARAHADASVTEVSP